MAKKSWTFELERSSPADTAASVYASRTRTSHTLDLEHNYWTAKRTIKLDGNPLSPDQIRSYGTYGFGSDDLLIVDGHECVVHITTNAVAYKYDFLIDGVSVKTGKTAKLPPQLFQMQPGVADRIPGWAWIFMVLCFVVGLGSIFAGLGVAALLKQNVHIENVRYLGYFVTPLVLQAIFSIITASKEPAKSERNRMGKCAAIVGRTGLIIASAVSFAVTI